MLFDEFKTPEASKVKLEPRVMFCASPVPVAKRPTNVLVGIVTNSTKVTALVAIFSEVTALFKIFGVVIALAAIVVTLSFSPAVTSPVNAAL